MASKIAFNVSRAARGSSCAAAGSVDTHLSYLPFFLEVNRAEIAQC